MEEEWRGTGWKRSGEGQDGRGAERDRMEEKWKGRTNKKDKYIKGRKGENMMRRIKIKMGNKTQRKRRGLGRV